MIPYLLSGYTSTPSSTGASIRDARLAGESAARAVEARLESLELACAGLWQLLKTRHGYTDEELVAAIREVDARDGEIDGKMTKGVLECPHCKRKLLTRAGNRCSWCGEEISRMPL